MPYRAVACSQVDGAGAESIGRDLASGLRFGYLNEAIVSKVAAEHGVEPSVVVEAERRKSLLLRVAELASFGAVAGLDMDLPTYLTDETDTVLSLVRDAVLEAADRGNVVLVAHAACYACAERADVLRVCVTAPFGARVARVAADRSIGEKEAAKWLRKSDAGRASYLKRVYGVEAESPTDYDLVVSTARLDSDAIVALVGALVDPAPGVAGGASAD